MNKYDSKLVCGILQEKGYHIAENMESANIVLINTCSVRKHAEQRVLGRLNVLAQWKREAPQRKLGIIGCMAQRLGDRLLKDNKVLDFIIGPDEYRTLPDYLQNGHDGPHICTTVRENESYSHLIPLHSAEVTGFVAIMRGCNNYCTYCVVPFTRGRERSRPSDAIKDEIIKMTEKGVKEVTLLGQNVNSYHDQSKDFPDLLEEVSQIPELLRIRFMTSHPKDLTLKLIELIAKNEKVCPHIHLPVQSGSDRILDRMNRGYTRKDYLILVNQARKRIPGITITSDIMVGFPGETETDFMDTVKLMKTIRFNEAFTYYYSIREETKAANFNDQVPLPIRLQRLEKIIKIQRKITLEEKKKLIGQKQLVLSEGPSKQSNDEWMGKSETNEIIVFPIENDQYKNRLLEIQIGDLRGSTLRGKILGVVY